MGRPDPMQADPQQEEHGQYEHPLESDTTYDDAVDEYPEGNANYQDPSAETNNMMNQQQQQYPPAQNPAAPQQKVNNPGRSYPPQAQQQPQMYAPAAGNYPPQQQQPQMYAPPAVNYPPQQQQPQMYQPPAGNYPPQQQQQQQQQQYQGPVQFPPTRPAPPVPMSPAPLKQQQFNNGSTTQGFPVQQQQQYQPGTPVMVSSHIPKVNGTNAWSTGLFDCMEDPNNALITAVFPCLTFGQIAEIIDNGHTTCGTSGIMYGAIAFCIAMPCLLSCTYRTKLRNQFDLVEAPGPDWAIHFLFEWCALCQAYRELKNRGLDPSIGWQGNQMRRQQQPVMMAPMNQSMMQ